MQNRSTNLYNFSFDANSIPTLSITTAWKINQCTPTSKPTDGQETTSDGGNSEAEQQCASDSTLTRINNEFFDTVNSNNRNTDHLANISVSERKPLTSLSPASMPLFNHFYTPVSILYTAECRVAMTPREVSSCLVGYKVWPFPNTDEMNEEDSGFFQPKIDRISYQRKHNLTSRTPVIKKAHICSCLPSDCWW